MAQRHEIGALRQRVTFEKQIRVADGGGGWSETWKKERTCWAKVEPLSGRELMHAMQLEHPVSHRVTVRYNAAVAAYHRDGEARRRLDIGGGRKLHILAIINRHERNRWLEIMATEGTTT